MLDHNEIEIIINEIQDDTNHKIADLRNKLEYLAKHEMKHEELLEICIDSPFILTKEKSFWQMNSFIKASTIYYHAKLRGLEQQMAEFI